MHDWKWAPFFIFAAIFFLGTAVGSVIAATVAPFFGGNTLLASAVVVFIPAFIVYWIWTRVARKAATG